MGQLSWVICILFFVLFQCNGSLGCLEQERRALLHLASMFHWDVGNGTDCCAWKRVKCDTSTHRVIQLSLDGLLQGSNWNPFPFLNMSYFLPFEDLQHLDLSYNHIGHDNPQIGKLMGFERLSELKRLEILNLNWNGFNSSIIPSSLGAIKSLKSLQFAGNRGSLSISGVSKLLSNLRRLEFLDLSSNDLRGSFPFHDLENMSKLKSLNLSFNYISGSIPQSGLSLSSLESFLVHDNNLTNSFSGVCGWKNLRDLDLSDNNFEGSIPLCISNLTSLRRLDVACNQITGIIPPSLFYGLTCLELLDFSGNRLSGKIPLCLSNLTSLRRLDVAYNHLTGIIPPSLFYGLTCLDLLDFSGNRLSGKIPLSSLSNFTSLEFLSFGYNQFGGIDSLNSFVAQLTFLGLGQSNLNTSTTQLLQILRTQQSLEYIDLSSNNLHGKFPGWMMKNNSRLNFLRLGNNLIKGHIHFPHNLGSLTFVDISMNQIQGELQLDIGDFISKVQSLNLSRNSLEGRLPSSLGNLEDLESLDLSSNNLSGEIPENLVFRYKRLQVFILSNNSFDGRIPPSLLYNVSYLEVLRLNNNQLTGDLASINSSIPSSLKTLDISQNHISGRIPSWIANSSKLKLVSMRNNSLSGPIPADICNPPIEFLDLSENQLSGSLPSCLSSMPLQYIHVHSNSLAGTIPKEFFESSNLVTLDLMHNKLSGGIPNHVGASVNLRILLLKGNHLSGSVPHEMCKMHKVGMLDLSYNNFSGSIPPCFGNIKFGKIEAIDPAFQDIFWETGGYGVYMNKLTKGFYSGGSFSIESTDQEEIDFTTKGIENSYKGGSLNSMAGIDLSCNQFTGAIPLEIGALKGVHALNFSHNQLTGQIPKTFSQLEQLESMDLSYNKLSGEIPSDLLALNFLEVFTVAHNNLSGRIPDMKAQFSTFEETSYEGNPLLCGPPLKKCNNNPLVNTPLFGLSDKYGIDLVSFLASFVATCAISLLGLVLVLYINPYWRRLWFDFVDACISFVFPWFSEAIYATSNPFT